MDTWPRCSHPGCSARTGRDKRHTLCSRHRPVVKSAPKDPEYRRLMARKQCERERRVKITTGLASGWEVL